MEEYVGCMFVHDVIFGCFLQAFSGMVTPLRLSNKLHVTSVRGIALVQRTNIVFICTPLQGDLQYKCSTE